jgi:O-methyltransferase
MDPRLYLDLLEDSLLGVNAHRSLAPLDRPRGVVRRSIQDLFRRRGWVVARWVEPDSEPIERGETWPAVGETMIGRARIRNIRACAESVIRDDVPGDFIETGVWRGGACIYMRGILAAHGVEDRDVWVADSFQGLPRPAGSDHPADNDGIAWHTYDRLAVSADEVRANFGRYHLLDAQVRFAEGWFSDTLPKLHDRTWAIARLDGDMYGSTMDALTNLYANLSPGGYLIVDDYHAVRACENAVTDFRAHHRITDPIRSIDGAGAFWRKSA